MKKISLIVLLLCLVDMFVVAMPDKDLKSGTAKKEAGNFSFTVYGEIPVRVADYAEPHYLGAPVEAKWNTFLLNSVQVSEQSVGFSNTTVRIHKPILYNAVQKVNKYVKKACKKSEMSHEKAVEVMSHVLDCANVICLESDSKSFEDALSEAESAEDILGIFENTNLIFQ